MKQWNRIEMRIPAVLAVFLALVLMFSLLPSQAMAAQTVPTRTPATRTGEALTPGPDVVVVISESYLNRLVDEALEEREDLQNPVVDLKDDATAEVAVSMPLLYGISVRPRAMVTLAVVDGEVRTRIESFDLNNMRVGRALVDERLTTLEDELNQTLNEELVPQLQPAGLRLTGVQTSDVALFIEMQAIQPETLP